MRRTTRAREATPLPPPLPVSPRGARLHAVPAEYRTLDTEELQHERVFQAEWARAAALAMARAAPAAGTAADKENAPPPAEPDTAAGPRKRMPNIKSDVAIVINIIDESPGTQLMTRNSTAQLMAPPEAISRVNA
ncbi:hypothetical protein T492DRAFT_876794 [Pavlovales sp. CCMP2436]|nr:hypothetical protein T492DRAFT_876794 [Pavlovales sp. CCMP2436]